MGKQLRCLNGHQWEQASPEDTLDLESSRSCPICGASSQTVCLSADREMDTETSTPKDSVPVLAFETPSTDSFGNLEILRELGRGGMGIVYLAFDNRHKRRVAVKTLRWMGPTALHRFKREFRVLADVAHPNLATLSGLVSDGATWFLTMEYVDGVDFLKYVKFGVKTTRHPSLAKSSEAELEPTAAFQGPSGPSAEQLHRLRNALRQLSEGIAALHEAGILHRDIKPSNVLVTQNERVVVLDFGLAAEMEQDGSHESTEMNVSGTVSYMSPEQAAGKSISEACDWYSVGVVLYEALAGCLPFSGRPLDILQEKQNTDPRPPCELVQDIPDDLNQLCMKLLRRDPEERATAADILSVLGAATPLKPSSKKRLPSSLEAAPFLGRDEHVAALNQFHGETALGEPVIVFVHGKSGEGKSTLVHRFLADIGQRDDAIVLTGRCYQRELVPFKAFDAVIDALQGFLRHLPPVEAAALMPRNVQALSRMFPVLGRVEAVACAPDRKGDVQDQQELRRRAFGALRELLARISDRAPLVLWIDDLQWGDVDSAYLLLDLIQPPDAPVLLFVGSYRSDEQDTSPFLQAFRDIQNQRGMVIREHEVAVGPLGRAESCRLALELLGRNDQEATEIAETIAQESGGNPFIVTESVKYVQSTTDVGPGGRITLQTVMKGRLTRSSEEERRLLEIVAVGGQPLAIDVAFSAADTVEAGPRVLAQLTAEHLIRNIGPTDATEIEMYHDRIRESLVAVLPKETVCDLHHRIATALEDTGQADPEALAVHLHGAEQFAEAARYYEIAADQAAGALAFDRAVELYRLALGLRHDQTTTDADLRTRLGDALANAGRGAEAAREYLKVAESSPTARQSELQLLAAMQYLLAGHIDDGLTALEAPLAAEGLSLPKTSIRALGSLLLRRMQLRLRGLRCGEYRPSDVSQAELHRIDTCWSVARAFSVVDTIRGADFELRSLLLAFRVGDPFRIARALSLEAAHVSSGGRSSSKRTAELLDVAKHLAEQISDPYATAFVLLCSGGTAYLVDGRWKEALDLCDQAEVVFRERCTGVAWELDTTHTFALWSLTYMGHIAELRRRRQVLLKEAQERGDLYAQTNLGTYIMALDRLGADDREGAKEELRDVISRWTQRGFHVQHHNATLAHTLVELYCGNGLAAWQRIRETFPAYRKSFLLRVQQVRIDILQSRARSALAAACDDAGSRTSLLRAASRDARRLRREKVPWATASAELIFGMVAWARGDEAKTAAMLESAIAEFDAADMVLHAAAAQFRLGQLVGGSRGNDLTKQAASRMEAQQIRDQSRFTWMIAPGDSRGA